MSLAQNMVYWPIASIYKRRERQNLMKSFTFVGFVNVGCYSYTQCETRIIIIDNFFQLLEIQNTKAFF